MHSLPGERVRAVWGATGDGAPVVAVGGRALLFYLAVGDQVLPAGGALRRRTGNLYSGAGGALLDVSSRRLRSLFFMAAVRRPRLGSLAGGPDKEQVRTIL